MSDKSDDAFHGSEFPFDEHELIGLPPGDHDLGDVIVTIYGDGAFLVHDKNDMSDLEILLCQLSSPVSQDIIVICGSTLEENDFPRVSLFDHDSFQRLQEKELRKQHSLSRQAKGQRHSLFKLNRPKWR